MSFSKKTIRDINLDGKTVLMRVDFNVPLDKGVIADDYRIQQALPTINYLLERKVRLVLCSHLGRPEGKANNDDSLFPVAKRLGELLGNDKVNFVKDCVGPLVVKAVKAMAPGDVVLLENVRFHAEEEANDDNFAQQLVADTGAEVFVQDAFGVVHHGAVSVSELPKYLPGVAGLLLEKEVDTITRVMQDPERPLVAVVGGAKISDKIDILTKFIDIADIVAVGGAMANTFLLADGIDVAKSLVEHNDVSIAKDILEKARAKAKQGNFVFYIPQDAVVAHAIDKTKPTRIVDWSAHVISAIENYPKRPPHSASTIADDEMILDTRPILGFFHCWDIAVGQDGGLEWIARRGRTNRSARTSGAVCSRHARRDGGDIGRAGQQAIQPGWRWRYREFHPEPRADAIFQSRFHWWRCLVGAHGWSQLARRRGAAG